MEATQSTERTEQVARYRVIATATRTVDGWSDVRQIPTFYLDGWCGSAVTAEKVARSVIDPFGVAEGVTVSIAGVQ